MRIGVGSLSTFLYFDEMDELQKLALRSPELSHCLSEIEAGAKQLISCFQQNHKLLLCGNGGSCADCEHIAGEYLYWEFYERTFRQAVVRENWKLIRSGMDDNQVELYDLHKDIHEDQNLAKEQPALVQSLLAQMEEAHQPHPSWPTPRSKKK